jgi:uncharacterized protein (DUF1778 family)
MSIIVPEAILEAVEEAAKRRDLSISEFVENTILAKASEVLCDPYLQSRAKRANGLGWRVLEQAPDVPPIPSDELS